VHADLVARRSRLKTRPKWTRHEWKAAPARVAASHDLPDHPPAGFGARRLASGMSITASSASRRRRSQIIFRRFLSRTPAGTAREPSPAREQKAALVRCRAGASASRTLEPQLSSSSARQWTRRPSAPSTAGPPACRGERFGVDEQIAVGPATLPAHAGQTHLLARPAVDDFGDLCNEPKESRLYTILTFSLQTSNG